MIGRMIGRVLDRVQARVRAGRSGETPPTTADTPHVRRASAGARPTGAWRTMSALQPSISREPSLQRQRRFVSTLSVNNPPTTLQPLEHGTDFAIGGTVREIAVVRSVGSEASRPGAQLPQLGAQRRPSTPHAIDRLARSAEMPPLAPDRVADAAATDQTGVVEQSASRSLPTVARAVARLPERGEQPAEIDRSPTSSVSDTSETSVTSDSSGLSNDAEVSDVEPPAATTDDPTSGHPGSHIDRSLDRTVDRTIDRTVDLGADQSAGPVGRTMPSAPTTVVPTRSVRHVASPIVGDPRRAIVRRHASMLHPTGDDAPPSTASATPSVASAPPVSSGSPARPGLAVARDAVVGPAHSDAIASAGEGRVAEAGATSSSGVMPSGRPSSRSAPLVTTSLGAARPTQVRRVEPSVRPLRVDRQPDVVADRPSADRSTMPTNDSADESDEPNLAAGDPVDRAPEEDVSTHAPVSSGDREGDVDRLGAVPDIGRDIGAFVSSASPAPTPPIRPRVDRRRDSPTDGRPASSHHDPAGRPQVELARRPRTAPIGVGPRRDLAPPTERPGVVQRSVVDRPLQPRAIRSVRPEAAGQRAAEPRPAPTVDRAGATRKVMRTVATMPIGDADGEHARGYGFQSALTDFADVAASGDGDRGEPSGIGFARSEVAGAPHGVAVDHAPIDPSPSILEGRSPHSAGQPAQEPTSGTGLSALEHVIAARGASVRVDRVPSQSTPSSPPRHGPETVDHVAHHPFIQREDSMSDVAMTPAPASNAGTGGSVDDIAAQVYQRVTRELRHELHTQRERKGAMVRGW